MTPRMVRGWAGESAGVAPEEADVMSSGTNPIVDDRSPQHFTRFSHDRDLYARNALTEPVKR
jgi:hypothetical protein